MECLGTYTDLITPSPILVGVFLFSAMIQTGKR